MTNQPAEHGQNSGLLEAEIRELHQCYNTLKFVIDTWEAYAAAKPNATLDDLREHVRTRFKTEQPANHEWLEVRVGHASPRPVVFEPWSGDSSFNGLEPATVLGVLKSELARIEPMIPTSQLQAQILAARAAGHVGTLGVMPATEQVSPPGDA